MSTRQLLITTASWEPRFIEGSRRLFKANPFSSSICFWFDEYKDRTECARAQFAELCSGFSPIFTPLKLFTPDVRSDGHSVPSYVALWKDICSTLTTAIQSADSFVFDITTVPREALWIILDLLTEAKMPGQIVYHRATQHGLWCGCEPERPHIVPKLGGLPYHDWPTKLLVVSGYDEDRSEQFIASYEPSETLIVFQEDVDLESKRLRGKQHEYDYGLKGTNITFNSVDCYASDWGYEKLINLATSFGKNANLIIASLGPKTSSVSLYRVHRMLPESCLVYAPCRNYNPQYSDGIGESLTLRWQPELMLLQPTGEAN